MKKFFFDFVSICGGFDYWAGDRELYYRRGI